MKKESLINPFSAYPVVLIELVVLAAGLFGLIALKNPWALILIIVFVVILKGFYIIYPNHSKVMVLF